jgi:hypothetical protein
MFIHGFAGGALARIILGLHAAYFPPLLVDNVVIVKGVSSCDPVWNPE